MDAGRELQPQDFGIGQLFWRIREAVIVGDAESGRIVLWNPAAEALFGYAATEATGRLIEVLIPEDLRPRHRAGLARFKDTARGAVVDAGVAVELPALHRTGRTLTIELTLSRLDSPPAGGRFVLAIIRDATARKLADEQRVRLAREQAARVEAEAVGRRAAFLAEAAAILASSLDYEATLRRVARLAVPTLADWCTVYMLGEDGQIRRVAVAHAGRAHADLARALGRYPPSPVSPRSSVAEAMRTGRSVLTPVIPEAYVEAIAQDAAHLELMRRLAFRSSLAVPLRARGETLGALAFYASDPARRYGAEDLALAEDLAGRAGVAVDNARLYRDARRAIRARDEFLTVAAHELRTPITSLLGYAQLLLGRARRGGALDHRSTVEAIGRIAAQSERLARLVGHLLDISRLEAGRLRLERQDTDLVALAARLVADLEGTTDRHRIAVRADGPVRAWADPLRLEQVLANLLENAIRYSPGGGPIDVELSRPSDDTVHVAVRDRGSGIPPDRRVRIFERFYQAHAESYTSGMGLGLYISRQIVELHGGELRAEFPEDGGTRFVVTLPVDGPVAAAAATPPPAER